MLEAMKTFLPLFALVAALSLQAQASLIGSPFLPESDARFNALENGTSIATSGITTAKIAAGAVTEAKLEVPSAAGLYVPRVARAVWDPSGDATMRTVAAHTLGVTIPANAVIRQVWFYTKTSLVSVSNNGTIAFSCNSANDLFSAADIDSSSGVAGQIGAGVEVGTAATMLKVTTACNITATVAVNAFTAGKIDLFVEYVLGE